MKEGWKIKTIGEVCSVAAGQSAPQGDANYCIKGTPFIKAGNLEDLVNGLPEHDVQNVSNEVAKRHRLKLYKKGSVIFAKSGMSCMKGYVYSLKTDCYVVSHLAILTPFDISTYFLRYLLEVHRPNSLVKDAAYPSISLEDIKSFRIPVPPLPEQERIVAELDCLSSVIEKQKEQLKELDNLAQAIFYDMFGDPITNEKGWEIKTLAEVCDVRDGTHDSPKYLEESDYVLITSKNITSDGEIDFSTANCISREDYDAINKRSYVDFGDIIMAMIGTIGKPIIVKKTDRKFCIKNVALIKFSTSTVVLNTYIQSLLSSSVYEEYIHSQNKGGTQKFIALGTIRKLPIPTPSLSLQQEFASKIEAIEKQKELIKKSIKETETLFNSRMDYYFN